MEVVSKRLLKELREIEKEAKAHPEIIDLSPESDDNLLHWRAILAGLPDTPYEGKKKKKTWLFRYKHRNILFYRWTI